MTKKLQATRLHSGSSTLGLHESEEIPHTLTTNDGKMKNLIHKGTSFLRHLSRDPRMAFRRLIGYLKPPLLSFQMGKVGSQTIKYTLEADYHVIHMHTREEMIATLPRVRRAKRKKLEIITATRDPVGREISVYFQNMLAPGYPFGVKSREDAMRIGADGLLERFHQRWQSGAIDTNVWFDRHFKTATGVDVYQHPFNVKRGWDIIEEHDYRILIVRFEDLNRNYLEAVNAFVKKANRSLSYSKMVNANVSDDKWYGGLLKEFKSKVSFSRKALDETYDSKYCNHFYMPEEIATMRSRFRVDEDQ